MADADAEAISAISATMVHAEGLRIVRIGCGQHRAVSALMCRRPMAASSRHEPACGRVSRAPQVHAIVGHGRENVRCGR